jgi:hypothetical protein
MTDAGTIEVPSVDRVAALEDRVTALEAGPGDDPALEGRVSELETEAADDTARDAALDARTTALEADDATDTARDAALASEVGDLSSEATDLGARTSALETGAADDTARDAALDARTSALEADDATDRDRDAALDARVAALESSTSAVNRPWEVAVTGGHNDAAVAAAVATVLSGRIGNAVQKRLVFPPGEYHLTQPIITNPATNTEQLEGLTIEGQGKRTTKIYWDASGAPLLNAIRRLRFFTISGMTVQSANAGNSFVYALSDTSGYNEAWRMRDLEFSGSWLRVFGLDGGSTANLNSEFVLEDVFTSSNSVFADAFFRCGGIQGPYNQQNQFLNYWIKNCCLTLASGTVFRFDKGGAIHVRDGSWSAASSTSGAITWFNMPVSNSNNRSACQLSVDGVRFEPKAANQKIITCAWGTGSVEFSNCCDLSSLQNTASYEYNLHQYTGQNPWGFGGTMPSVRYVNHQGAGYHQYDGAAVARGGITYQGCYFYRGVNGDMANATSGTSPALRWSSGAPRYAFQNCDNVATVGAWTP